MASVAVYPLSVNSTAVTGTVPTTDSLFQPTTTNVYEVELSDEGKVGLLVTYLAASSVGSVRLKITPPSSTDGAWGYGVGNCDPSNSTYFTQFTNDFAITASSHSRTFFGPFESARYGSLSTVTALAGSRVLKCNFDASTGHTSAAVYSTLSTTLATVCTTIAVMAFKMP
jgi:hypothetical protein